MARRIDYLFKETVTGLRRNGLVGFAAMSTVFISLFLLGGALLIGRQVGLVVDAMRRRVIELDHGSLVRDQVRGVYGVGS